MSQRSFTRGRPVASDGYYEPLVRVWSPYALQHLMGNVKKGATGPIRTVKELQGNTARSTDEYILLNVNTKDGLHGRVCEPPVSSRAKLSSTALPGISSRQLPR